MTTLSAKKLISLIDSPKSNSKEKVKLISRKQETNSFARKNTDQVLAAESISIPRRHSRQKTKSEYFYLSSSNSLSHLTTPVGQQIKFMSPKNAKDFQSMSLSQLSCSQKSPRFTRTAHIDPKKLFNTSIMSKISEKESEDNFAPKISQISLQSVLKKQTEETMPHTEDNSALERQNHRLRQENEKLKKHITQNDQKIKELSDSIRSLQNNKKRQPLNQKCKNCVALEQKLKLQVKYISLYQSSMNERQKQLEKTKHQLVLTRADVQRERQKFSHLHQQYRSISIKYLEVQKIKTELASIIDSLNSKLKSTEQQMHYIGIQHNILLKKKQQNQLWKAQVDKLAAEKTSLKQLVCIYKQKLDVIKKINSKQLTKSKSQKDVFYEDLFELSSQQSDRQI